MVQMQNNVTFIFLSIGLSDMYTYYTVYTARSLNSNPRLHVYCIQTTPYSDRITLI